MTTQMFSKQRISKKHPKCCECFSLVWTIQQLVFSQSFCRDKIRSRLKLPHFMPFVPEWSASRVELLNQLTGDLNLPPSGADKDQLVQNSSNIQHLLENWWCWSWWSSRKNMKYTRLPISQWRTNRNIIRTMGMLYYVQNLHVLDVWKFQNLWCINGVCFHDNSAQNHCYTLFLKLWCIIKNIFWNDASSTATQSWISGWK